ncbi:HAMP domain-containing protein [Actinoplanes sp. TBRC 11911]|nr:HAMP domain-containing protein [Actinoplanes sp. TBRC 11911]
MRSALAAGVVVAVASLLAGGVLLLTAHGVLVDNVNTAAGDRATQLSTAMAAGDASAVTAALRPASPGRTVAQVLDSAGQVIGASTAIADHPPISALRPAAGKRLQETKHLNLGEEAPFLIIATGVHTPTGVQTALVAESTDTVNDADEAIAAAVVVGLPVLTIIVAVATFLFVGRTLRPVEAMTRQAATITARNLHTRLPVPVADDEIAALADTMNTMLDRIETASAAQRRFVADASHELRSPLATIHANADLLVSAGLPDTEAAPAGRIHTESRRMAKLVDDLLLLARVDDQALRVRHEDVDLDDLVYVQRDRVSLEHPQLLVDGRVEPVRISGDPEQLHRVLRNLVDNAVRHARKTVTISLTARDSGGIGIGIGEIVIGNDGPPIPAADRERIFDRFVRLDDSRSRHGGGAGLGLAIARDIVTAHHGTLTADALTHGAAMRITLPLMSNTYNM